MIAFGLNYETSDFGDGALTVGLFMLRMICTNLASAEDMLRQVHLGKRLAENLEFSEKTYRLDTQTMASAVGDIVGNVLAPATTERYCEAIKAANPNTLVLTAGLAATLMAENLRTPNFWTEVDYTTEFVLEGGLLYADCIGVHYNVGTTPPDTTDSAPKGDAAFVYFPRLVDYYAQLARGTRPICVTELGYLTGEGYAPLAQVAPDFNWAQNTTILNQAAWLAQVVRMSAADPRVEMLIVWNVDYWSYGADPHAGYAIIRKDGGCPACETLHALGLR